MADVLDQRFATPAGLDDTFLSDGTDQPANYQHGVFVLDNEQLDTSMVPNVAFFTYSVAESAIISTLADSLDMVEMWADGSLFTTQRVPGPAAFLPNRQDTDGGTTVARLRRPVQRLLPVRTRWRWPDGHQVR